MFLIGLLQNGQDYNEILVFSIGLLLDLPQVKIKEVYDVLWISFYSALEAVFKSYLALVKFFKEKVEVIQEKRRSPRLQVLQSLLPASLQMKINKKVSHPLLANLKLWPVTAANSHHVMVKHTLVVRVHITIKRSLHQVQARLLIL